MALALFDRVQETTTTTGTGSVTLGGAVPGFQSFAVVGNGNTCYYTIVDGSAWEVGVGTYSTSGPTLARTTILSNSNGNTTAITLAAGTKSVFLTYPASKSVNLNESGNVSPLGTVSSGVWQGTTVGVAYGGTGVTASSGANSVMLRDANQNVSINRLNQSNTNITASAGTTALTAGSSYSQTLVGTGNHTISMPDATLLATGVAFEFNNNATGTLTLTDYASATIGTVTSGGAVELVLLSNGTVGGTWDVHGYIPENVTWGTNSLALGATVISGGTWQGGTIATGYGGTGLTSYTANGAVYANSSTTLTSGTLPISAGGTGNTTGNSATTSQTNFSNLTIGGSQVLYAGNYNSYAPTLTGGGASGTWSINVTGNAATATTATTATNQSGGTVSATTGAFSGAVSMTANAQGYAAPTLYVRGDIRAQRDSGNTGVIYFGNSSGTYLYYDGTNYSMPNGQLDVGGNRVLTAGNYNSYAPTLTGGGATGTWNINISGNAATATLATSAVTLTSTQSNWGSTGVLANVVGLLSWRNYGNSHVIFDASASLSPSGGAVNNTNSQVAWSSSYPTLMGWNGSNTYGVRVDSARTSDSTSGSSTSVSATTSTGIQTSYSAAINTTTPGLANYGFAFSGVAGSDYAQGITWGWNSTNAQAGIYVQSSGAYGTKMYFGTTDSFAVGSKTSMSIDHNGTIQVPRGYLQSDYSLRAPIFYDSNDTGYYVDPAGSSLSASLNGPIVMASTGWTGEVSGKIQYHGNSWYLVASSYFHFRNTSGLNTFYGDPSGNTWSETSSRAPIFYDSNDTAYYLNPNGMSYISSVQIVGYNSASSALMLNFPSSGYIGVYGSVVNSAKLLNFRATAGDATRISTAQMGGAAYINGDAAAGNESGAVIIAPGGGRYATTASTVTGAIKITIPEPVTDVMCTMTIRVYTYDGAAFEITCGGYPYGTAGTSGFVNAFAYMNTQRRGTLNVRFGTDGSNACVWIGETGTTWNYPQVQVIDFTAGYYGRDPKHYADGWTISFVGSFNTVFNSINVYAPVNSSANSGPAYAPIYYDSEDTAYYVDPAGTSRIRKTNLIASGSGWDDGLNLYSSDASNRWNLLVDSGASNWLRFAYNQAERLQLQTDGTIIAIGNMRSPIFYDSNDTGYYFDGASTSRLNRIDFTNLYLAADNSYGFLGSSIYVDTINSGYAGDQLEFNYVRGTWAGISHDSLRAPIFYDYDNTGYYVDPASTSNLNRLVIQPRIDNYYVGNVSGTDPVSNWQSLTDTTGQFIVSQFNNITSGAFTNYPPSVYTYGSVISTRTANHSFQLYTSHTGDITYKTQWNNDNYSGWLYPMVYGRTNGAGGVVYGTIFYDQNDTTYYVNPNGGSYLYGLTLSGNSYFRPNTWIQLDGDFGIFSNVYNSAHFLANIASTYTQWRLIGSRNSYGGIYDTYSAVNGIMYDASGNGGVYRESTGRWYLYHNVSNNCMGVGTASTSSAYGIYVVKGGYFDGRVDGTIFYDANNTGYYCDPASTSYVNSLQTTGLLRSGTYLYLDQQYGSSIVGAYASTRYQGVFAMGDAYKLPLDGTSSGNLYGIAWSYPSAGGPAGNLDSHGMLVLINGGFGSCMSYSIVASSNITAYSDERLKTNWQPMPDNYVDRLAKIKVGIYDRIDGEKLTQVGVSAQSFQELLPQAITTAQDEMQTLSVSYGNAALASAVELAKYVTALEQRISQLEARL